MLAVGALLSKQARRHTPLRGQHCLLHLAVPLGALGRCSF